jgi:transposase
MDVFVPREFPPEFKRDVVTVARRGDLPVNEVAADFDVSPETVRRWMRQADADDGVKDGLTSGEQPEIVQLRRTLWGSKMGHRGLTCGFACGGGAAGSIAVL